jgi:hypothetical protein
VSKIASGLLIDLTVKNQRPIMAYPGFAVEKLGEFQCFTYFCDVH